MSSIIIVGTRIVCSVILPQFKCDYVGDSRLIVGCRLFISWPEFFRFPPCFRPVAVAILALQDSIEFRVCKAQQGCGQREKLQRKLLLEKDATLMQASPVQRNGRLH